MNKKRLSVVMAGAMLASSVAPVLAATESEVDSSRLGSLVEKVKEQLTSKVFDEKDTALAGKSAYYVKVNGKELKNITNMSLTTDAEKEELRKELQEEFKNLKAGDKVEIFSKGFREEGGKVFSTTNSDPVKYTSADFEEKTASNGEFVNATTEQIAKDLMPGGSTNVISKAERVRVKDGVIKVYLNDNSGLDKTKFQEETGLEVDTTGVNDVDVLKITADAQVLDFTKYIDKTTKEVKDITSSTAVANIAAFPIKYATSADIKGDELVETIKITGTQYNYKAEDLYDGLMLTTAGHDMLSLVKEMRALRVAGKATINFETLDNTAYPFKNYVSENGKYDTEVKLPKINNEYGFVIRIKDAFDKETVHTIKGSEKYANVVATWLYSELARVDILAGDNRYETAVEIAKEQALVNGSTIGTDKISNIVLVNGNSLVDGLAAAPLAAVKTNKIGNNNNAAAPVLLTEADELPKATKAYLLELMKNHIIGTNGQATIHLVGGTAVLNRSLEKELDAMGFDVKRYNGDNREETSLKIAEEIGIKDEAFVVGAEGEADAMSIAGVASREKTPIIVSKKGGLTYDALKELEDEKVTIVGGENAVSKADEEAIKEEASVVRRIEGSNRQATNAAVIKEFYHGDYLDNVNGVNKGQVTSVIVAKDGRANKTQLVDALAAANLGVQFNAPIVLATDKLSADQLDALQLRAKSAKSLYQVGIGVERSVVETIASKLGLLNK